MKKILCVWNSYMEIPALSTLVKYTFIYITWVLKVSAPDILRLFFVKLGTNDEKMGLPYVAPEQGVRESLKW